MWGSGGLGDSLQGEKDFFCPMKCILIALFCFFLLFFPNLRPRRTRPSRERSQPRLPALNCALITAAPQRSLMSAQPLRGAFPVPGVLGGDLGCPDAPGAAHGRALPPSGAPASPPAPGSPEDEEGPSSASLLWPPSSGLPRSGISAHFLPVVALPCPLRAPAGRRTTRGCQAGAGHAGGGGKSGTEPPS